MAEDFIKEQNAAENEAPTPLTQEAQKDERSGKNGQKNCVTPDICADQPAETGKNGDGGATKKAHKKPDRATVKHGIITWLLMTLGSVLVAGGVYFFKAPNHFATGGVSGISIILAKYVPGFKQSYFVMIINVALLILGFIFLGKGCTVRTLYCSLAYSGVNLLLEQFLPIEKLSGGAPTLTNQPLMELVYAMLLTGIGSAIMFNCKASSGGTDIVALILKKFTRLDTGKALLLSDSVIACAAFVFGAQAGLFSLLGLFSKAFIIDGIIENIGKTKYITIITTIPETVGKYIIEEMKRDYTSYKATGGYTGAEKTVMITVCRRGEALKLKLYVKKADATAFVIITDANEILGKGFRETL